MSQYPPPQPYPQQGPPMGPPPMGGPPMYGPPPKKKGIVLLVLGVILLIIGIVLSVMAAGGAATAASGIQNIAEGSSTFVAPGEATMTLDDGTYMIMAIENGEYQGRTYSPTDVFPTNDTVFQVTGPNGADIPVTMPQMQASGQSGASSGEAVRQFVAPSEGDYTISITNPQGMEERPILIMSFEEMMELGLGVAGAAFGFLCGIPLGLIGLILIVVWLIVRK
jgi:hypothetical protein